MIKRLIILGAPGVGKGTQASRLATDFGWAHISTGDMLRDAVRQGTDLGHQAKRYMEKGELVPDKLMVQLIGERLQQDDCRPGFILDGFPRTDLQAERLDDLLHSYHLQLDDVVHIDVSNEEIVRRLSRRLVCDTCSHVVTHAGDKSEGDACSECGGRLIRRKDDQPETIRHRLNVYENETRSLIQYYSDKHLLRVVDGLGSMDDVYSKIRVSLGLSLENA